MYKISTISTTSVESAPRQVADGLPGENESEKEFIERGLLSRAHALRTGRLYSTQEVLAELDKILETGRKRRGP